MQQELSELRLANQQSGFMFGAEKEAMRRQIADSQAHASLMVDKNHQLACELESEKLMIGGLTGKVDNLENLWTQLAAMKEQLSDTRQELDDTRQELDGKRHALDDTRRELDGTTRELDDTRRELDGTQLDLDGTQLDLDGTRRELDDTRRLELEIRQDLDSVISHKSQLVTELAAKSQEATAYNCELADVQSELVAVKAELAMHLESISEQHTSFENAYSVWRTEKAALHSELQRREAASSVVREGQRDEAASRVTHCC